MSIQFLGMIGHRLASEIIPASGTLFDKNYIADFARAHEQAGFDRVLVGYWSDQPDGFLVTAHAAASTSTIKFLLAHRPGFVAPTLAARKLATLDNLTDGRLAVHIISGGSDSEQRRDGDFLDKAQRYARTDEFLTVLKHSLQSASPYDHQGEFYQSEQAFSAIKPQQPHLPIYFGGSSPEAIDVASRQADVFALWGEPLAGAAETVKTVRAAAALPVAQRYVVTCGSSLLARFALEEVAALTGKPVYLLKGGNAAWRAAQLPLESGESRLLQERNDRYRRPYEGTDNSAAAMQAYLEWEYGLIAQLDRDGTHDFHVLTQQDKTVTA